MRKKILLIASVLFAAAVSAQEPVKTDSIPAGAVITDTYKTRNAIREKGEVIRLQQNRYEGDYSILSSVDTISFKLSLNGSAFIDKESVAMAQEKFITAFNTRMAKRFRRPLRLASDERDVKADYNIYSVYDNGETHGLVKLTINNQLISLIYATGYGKTMPEISQSFIIAAEHAGTYFANQVAATLGWGK